jgi:MerR family transcriptional regulator, copper efflux regulator
MRAAAVARLAGVSTDTLRLYEKRGLLPKPARAPNGYRTYSNAACTRVRLIRQALAIGFTLEELGRILRVRDAGGIPCRGVRALGGEKLALLDARLAELARARERLAAVLVRWDGILAETPNGTRAALLDALEGLVEGGEPSPFVPPALRRRRPRH